EVCKQIKKAEETANIPIIFLTAKTETEDIVRGFELGAADYVLKPFNSAELLSRVHTHLSLKHKEDALVRSNAEQKELLHILSHDLNNFFTSIIMSVEILQNYPADLDENLERIKRGALNGAELIDYIRQIRALEDKDDAPSFEKVSLKDAINESIFTLIRLSEKKQVSIINLIDSPYYIYAERVSFVHSLLNNLLSNAIKFSFINSKIECEVKEEDGDLLLSIRDYGIGMSESLKNSIFDISKITTRPGTSGERGTGFGLPLVKKLVERFGGSIFVESKEKDEPDFPRGTKFTLKLKKAEK
ncbi:MAG: hybrid sensor histidine kinase/response regulator, partial [Leptospiraceae bacterium]|nr:hybrid sensor histidine kinase/response regulator [Leptospiraceae bacterium]